MAYNNDSELGSDSTDLAEVLISLLDLNSTNHDKESQVWDCNDLSAANSLLHLMRCSWLPLKVNQDICESSLPIKKRPYRPGPSTRDESVRALVNISHTGAASELLIKKMAENEDIDSGGESGSCNSTAQTAAVIPEESGDRNKTQDRLETVKDPAEILFQLWSRIRSWQWDDQEQSTGPPREPASRYLPPDYCLCFLKKLTLSDASHVDGKLDIETFHAVLIPSCPKISRGERKSVELMVFDYENRRYNMELTAHNFEGVVACSINGEWRNFIRAHNLQHGDIIFFCRNRDQRINAHDFYYVILFDKMNRGEE